MILSGSMATYEERERFRREAELAANLDQLEWQEEGLIDLAASEGVEIMRRQDASPAAVLGVAVAKQRAQEAA